LELFEKTRIIFLFSLAPQGLKARKPALRGDAGFLRRKEIRVVYLL
jgi:hypothetical protein